MAAIDRIKSAASGAVVIGTAVGARAVRTARPLLARAVGAVTGASRSGTRPAWPAPAPPAPAAASSAEAEAEAEKAKTAAEAPSAPATPTSPTPAVVAKNIAPHPPAATAASRKPAKRSAPGAKLPVRKATDD
jgi:hypothetical protein